MKLTDRQINTAIIAMAVQNSPHFHALPPAEKTSLGQATWYWFSKVLDKIPDNVKPRELLDEWDLMRDISTHYIVGAIKHTNPQHRERPDDEIKQSIRIEDIEAQTELFMRLSIIGLEAIEASNEMYAMADNFDTLDLNSELEKLLFEND